MISLITALLGGFYGLMSLQQSKINDLAVSQAITTAQLEATARMQDMILTRLERIEDK
jgi:hypothetical protein